MWQFVLTGLCMHILYPGNAALCVESNSYTRPFIASTDIAATYSGCSITATSGIGILQAPELLHMRAMMRYRHSVTVLVLVSWLDANINMLRPDTCFCMCS